MTIYFTKNTKVLTFAWCETDEHGNETTMFQSKKPLNHFDAMNNINELKMYAKTRVADGTTLIMN